MAFVVECPFCKLRAKAPERAVGAIGKCPRCGNTFTFAAVDDQHLPESAPASDNAEAEVKSGSAVGAAIAEAEAARPASEALDAAAASVAAPPSGFQPARIGGALAVFLSGLALASGAVSFLHDFVIPLSIVGMLTGIGAGAAAFASAQPRLVLPAVGSAAAAAVLVVAWFFPALLGPAYEFSRQRPEPTPVGLAAIPLAGAPDLAEVPEWTDAGRYALQRDGLRVQVIRVGLLPPAKNDAKAPAPPNKERFVVSVRVSLHSADAKPLPRGEGPSPMLSDEMGKPHALLQTEYFDLGGGAGKPGLYPVPTSEETFVFEPPAKGWNTLRLELPATRWQGSGVFRFAIPAPKAQPKND